MTLELSEKVLNLNLFRKISLFLLTALKIVKTGFYFKNAIFSILSQQKLAKFRLNNVDNRDDSADQEYWAKYEHLIDEKSEKLWDAMLYGLQKYQYLFLVEN